MISNLVHSVNIMQCTELTRRTIRRFLLIGGSHCRLCVCHTNSYSETAATLVCAVLAVQWCQNILSDYLDSFDSHQNCPVIAADIISLGLPNLPEVSLAQHRLQPQPGPRELPDGAQHVSSGVSDLE